MTVIHDGDDTTIKALVDPSSRALRVALYDSSGSPSSGGALTDHSGTITLGGTAEELMPANASRRYLLISNPSDTPLWFNIGGTAAIGGVGSIEVVPGWMYKDEGDFVPTDAISIIGATTGKAYTAKEG